MNQSKADLERHLEEHIDFLMRSADAFDAGYISEAKRMAVSVRVLLHETKRSTPVLGQLGRLNGKFISTALPYDEKNVSTQARLVQVVLAGPQTKYVAPLDGGPIKQWLPFREWWEEEPVFVDDKRQMLTRKGLVLEIASGVSI